MLSLIRLKQQAAVLLTLFTLLGICLPQQLHSAQNVGLETLQQVVQAPFKSDASLGCSIKSFAAQFEQVAHIASLNRSKQGHGKVLVRFNADAPAAFRWDYLEPEEQHIISNGSRLWVYLPANNRVMISDVAEHLEQGDDPLLFLRSLDNLERYFSLSLPEPTRADDGAFLLQLTPKNESVYVRNLVLHIPAALVTRAEDADAAEVFPLSGVTILDPNGNTTSLKFSRTRVNTAPESAQFNFRVPPGVDIVRPDPPAQK